VNDIKPVSKPKTAEEVRVQVLAHIRHLSKYWATLLDKTIQDRCDGLAFSILNIFDGTTTLPAFDLVVRPHPDDKQFHINEGSDWYEDGMVVNDCMMHEEFYT
jgi:hypothetical protein